jgi:hypothetical protein
VQIKEVRTRTPRVGHAEQVSYLLCHENFSVALGRWEIRKEGGDKRGGNWKVGAAAEVLER